MANRADAFALAERSSRSAPWVDTLTVRLLAHGVHEVTRLAKRAYARLSAFDLPGPTGATPVALMATRTAQGLARAFEIGAAKDFTAPEPPSSLEIAALDGLVRELLAE